MTTSQPKLRIGGQDGRTSIAELHLGRAASKPTAWPADRVDVSVVVPVKDEHDSLGQLVAEITTTLESTARSFEVILVDDGSRDASWPLMREIAASRLEVRAIRQRRNFGKAAALGSGFGAARGDVVVTMDGDLQDDPAEIPHLLSALENGCDVVSGWKRARRDPLSKRLPSKFFNAVARRVSGLELHDMNCGLKAYDAAAARTLAPFLYGELHRYLPCFLAARGFRVAELEVHHRPRRFGRSKYGFGRLAAGAWDLLTVILLTRFRYQPLHAFGAVAAVVAALGATGSAAAVATGHAATAVAVVVAGLTVALLLLAAGLVCELVVHGLGPGAPHTLAVDAVRVGEAWHRERARPEAELLARRSSGALRAADGR